MVLPYFDLQVVTIGPLHIFVWGSFIAAGIGVFLWRAYALSAKYPKKFFERIVDVTTWMIIGMFLCARLAHVFFYEPAFFAAHPLEIFMVWHGGLASTGGIFGAVVAALLYFRHFKLPILQYADFICAAMPLGWVVGRIGCYVTHMHPGILLGPHALLAVAYPDGPRADLGLYEAIAWLGIALFVWVAHKKQHSPGFYVASVAMLYGVIRFVLDFFRAQDVMMPDMRYAGLTPAQYAMIILFFVGAALFTQSKRVRS